MKPGGTVSDANFGFGLGGEFPVSEKLVFTGGFNFYFPAGSSYLTSINAIDSLYDPPTTEVVVNNIVTYGQINTGIKYYLVGNHADEFGFYAGGKIGGTSSKLKINLGEYDRNNYATEIPDHQVGKFYSATVSLLMGVEKSFKPCSFYINGQYNHTIKKHTGELSYLNVSSSFGINIGVKFKIGSN